ncbi:MAG TPA: hypothetical protein VK157_14730 [Phycisphaerales bacterium]|nr:hypothetical protein [Phycisphaerales bacterium]
MMNLSGWELLLIFIFPAGMAIIVAGGLYLVIRLAVKHGKQDAERNRPR